MLHLPNITLRPVHSSDLPKVVNLCRQAFAPSHPNEEIEREWFGNTLHLPGRRLFLAVDDQTEATCGGYAQVDLKIHFQGQEFPAMGIAAVAVAPERRGQKVAQLLIEHALEDGRSHQIPLIMLYPFQHGFYRRLGWAWVGRSHQYRVAAHHLPNYPERLNLIAYDPSLKEALQQVYQQAAKQQNGWLQRYSWQWEEHLKPKNGQEIYCYKTAGKLQGYLIFQFVQLKSTPHLLAVVVREWVALTAAAYRGILGFLSSLRDQVATVIWNTHPEDPFPHLLKEQRCDPALATTPFDFGLTHRFGEIGGGFMWRIVNLKRAFELRFIHPGAPFALTFQVSDPIFGNKTITAEFINGRMQCCEQPAPVTINLSIEQLTQLFCGVRRVTELMWMEEIQFDSSSNTSEQEMHSLLKQLDAAWQTTPPFCWDFF